MIIERAEVDVVEGAGDQFLTIVRGEGDLFSQANGCKWVKSGLGFESPNKVLMLAEWDTLEAHEAVSKKPEFAALMDRLGPLIVSVSMEHFELN